ncbi:MAG: FmdB family transcriptional regulator [Acidimicrobiales bacterium]|nr:FmdB family transcriptional regulator [Acidimicrobiales bacterium]
MPTYVYKFVDTGETIEVQQAFSDATLTEATHPATGQVMPVRKVFTPVGVTFKGGGFYKTDSRGSSSSTSSSGSGSGSGSSDASSSSSSSTSGSSTPSSTASSSRSASSSGSASSSSSSSAD